MAEPWELVLRELAALRSEVAALREEVRAYGGQLQAPALEIGATSNSGSRLSHNQMIFSKMVSIYEQERRRKAEMGRKVASGRRVARLIAELMAAEVRGHLERSLPNAGEVTVSCDRLLGDQTDPIHVVVRKESEVRAVCRVFVDLGWAGRGRHFARTVSEMMGAYNQAGVAKDQVFLVVASLLNSVETTYIEDLIGIRVRSLQAFLESPAYRPHLDEYVHKAKGELAALPNPLDQVCILSADQHPNGWETSGDEVRQVIDSPHYRGWIDSLSNVLDGIDSKCRA